jgi:hypothetical protein
LFEEGCEEKVMRPGPSNFNGLLIGWCSAVERPSEEVGSSDQDKAMTDREKSKPVEEKIKVVASACDSAAKHYDDYARTFVALDAKAQGTATTSGIVLAALATFFKDGDVSGLVRANHCWLLLVLAVPITALSAIVTSLWGARITEVVMPFDAPEQIADAEVVLGVDNENFTQNHVATFYQRRLEHWKEAFDSIATVMDLKAKKISIGQGFMFASLVLLIVIFVVVLVR